MKLSISKGVHMVEPGDFEPSEYWYPRALNSNLHPLVAFFLNLTNEQIIERYTRLNPWVDKEKLKEILFYTPKYFKWAGTDLMYVMDYTGRPVLTVIETNSCPSGQKSMPLPDYNMENSGYYKLMRETFKPIIDNDSTKGGLALIYDKNPMENVGYAAAMADVFDEPIYLAEYKHQDAESVKFLENKLHILDEYDNLQPIRAAFRYVTQQPWNRIPERSATLLLNPIEACLAGGRNKSKAYEAYTSFNDKFQDFGIRINTPQTFLNVGIYEIESHFRRLNGAMVVKVPDSNAGQGVYTIVSESELNKVLNILKKLPEQQYLVQELIFSNHNPAAENAYYHVGTLPDLKGRSFAFDARMMVHATENGMRPLAIYSRKSRMPLNKPLPEYVDSWEVYGTNLSVKSTEGWTYDDVRLVLFDVKNFGELGLGLSELIDGFVQTCQSVFAIDQQAIQMFDAK